MSADARGLQPDSWPHDDPLLDACLGEVLGGQSPPDLTARILATWEQRRAAADAASGGSQGWIPVTTAFSDLSLKPNLVPQSVQLAPVSSADRDKGRNWRASRWVNATVATCLIVGLAFAGSFVYRHRQPGNDGAAPRVAHSAPKTDSPTAILNEPRHGNPQPEAGGIAESHFVATPGDGSTVNSKPAESQLTKAMPPGGFDQPPPFASPQNTEEASPAAANDYVRAQPRPDYDVEVIAAINRHLHSSWQSAGVIASPDATDGEWARRTYLRVLGRIPTYEELVAFENSPSLTRKEELVNQLLFDEEYVEQYARHWSSVWTNLLIGRTGGADEDDLASREGLEQYLRRAFQFNKRYDQMVFELVSATGSNRPGTEGYNGAVNFVLGNYTHNYTLATSKTAQVFLGKRLHCVQCHNHPFEDWTQDDYWGLNAFFRQAAVVRDADKVRLVNRDFPGETGDIANAEIFYDRLNGVRKVVYPTFLDGTTINPHGQVAQVDRRRELANFLSDSRDLSRALVNRMWGHFLGHGFVNPVDDLRPNNSISHPELLDYVADQFAAHDYDTKRLIRWIAMSDAFARSSRITPNNLVDVPENGVPPLFSRYYTRQMTAEEIYDSLALLASNGDRSTDVFTQMQERRAAWLGQFTVDMQTDEGDEATIFNGTIPQSLAMMNGEVVQAALDSPQGLLNVVARSDLKPNDKLDRIFLAAVARKPLKREIDAANRLLAMRQGDLNAALQDLWWALLNSNEFILDH